MTSTDATYDNYHYQQDQTDDITVNCAAVATRQTTKSSNEIRDLKTAIGDLRTQLRTLQRPEVIFKLKRDRAGRETRSQQEDERKKMVGPAPDKKISTSNFFSVYDELCRKRKMMPLRNVKEHAWRKSIDFYTDRIKCDEWIPIIEAIATDRSLHYVAIRSRYEKKGDIEEFNTRERASKATGRPAIQTKFVMDLLLRALHNCISRSTHLTCLVLEGLALTEEYLSLLCAGISKCCSLQNISFHRCCLGDAGCEMICNTIKNSPNIRTIGMSGCNISEKGAYHLYLLLKENHIFEHWMLEYNENYNEHQQMERYNESWVQSLRYRAIDGAMLGGVRRITLNDNKELGDAGIAHFIEILKDDFWLKAIDLQNCGITDHGAFSILQMLEINNVLLVVDIRNNRYISSYIENEIMKTLARNNMQNLDESKEVGKRNCITIAIL
ncbi:centrosomal protein of 78 kDa-like [Schistocerca americana]|uniref:centrosomal protein of 78 kDa-like n=1 Tax=Schistocerca americana TaxID=7009 RepID=UPI001F4FB2EB|nr:centrosomal protein of 78 kDa-like [Schistocerca americana]